MDNQEIWCDVKGYEGLYKVSNLGRIKMLERQVFANKSKKTIKAHILKQYENPKGYLFVDLWSKNKGKRFFTHRIVLNSFVGASKPSQECNHKNENRKDNRIENIEWLTHKANLNYGNRTKKHKDKLTNHPSLSKIVQQFTLDGVLVAEYPSCREAKRKLRIHNMNINHLEVIYSNIKTINYGRKSITSQNKCRRPSYRQSE